jgi:tetratricopeptide (TPR) repeat protein
MRNRSSFVILLALVLSSCAGLRETPPTPPPAEEKTARVPEESPPPAVPEKPPPPAVPEKPPPPAVPEKPPPPAKKHRPPGRERVAALVTLGDYSEALKLITKGIKMGQPEVFYQKEYVRAINGLTREGTDRFEAGLYWPAGRSFHLALEHYPKEAEVREGIARSPEKIRTYIEECSVKLMEAGLLRYREGDLDGAVAVWEKIILFNPGYEEARQALETARLQLEKLKAL